MKQKLAALPIIVERSPRWFKGALEGIASRVVRWVQGPSPREKRSGRSQLNITDDQLQAVADQIQAYPAMGGKKGAANLAHNQVAWVGAESYDAANDTLAQLAGEELQERSKGRPTPAPYQPPVATGLGQVWGGDIFEIRAWDVRFDVCDFLDVYNQEYVALEATLHTADSGFVGAACFEAACQAKGNKPPTVATKTDRGAQFKGLFSKALQGRTHHEQIPPGCPWFNGESERGHRDARALIHAELSKLDKPKKGKELAAVQKACVTVKYLLNEVISKPSLGNVTPKEIADGVQDKVRAATARYVEQQREARRHRVLEDRRPLADRLSGMLGLKDWTRQALLRFLRLRSRDYKFIEEGSKVWGNFRPKVDPISAGQGQRDTTRENIATVLSLTVMMLLEFVLKEYFGGLKIELRTFIERFVSQATTIRKSRSKIVYQIEGSFRDKDLTGQLRTACAEITRRQMMRDGKLLVFEVVDPPDSASKAPRGIIRPPV